MKTKKVTLILLLALGALLLSACGGGRAAVHTWPGLAADAERAYITNGSFIYAVDVKTGQQVWQYPEKADGKHVYFATPVLTDDGQLLIGSEGTDHGFVSVNPETGKDNWAAPFTGAKSKWVASPLVFDGKIYAPNTDGFIYVLDMNGQPTGDSIDVGGALWSAPVTDGAYIYIASLDHHVHVIDPAQNKSIAFVALGGAAPGSPLVTDGGVYIGSFSSNIEFIDPNGKDKVVADAQNWVWGTPALDDGTLYYADLDGNVFSFDVASGQHNWTDVKPDGPIVASPLVVGDQIYVATEAGTFFALDRDAKIVYEKNLEGNIYTTPVASSDLIIVAPYKSEILLAAYDADGKQAWTFAPVE